MECLYKVLFTRHLNMECFDSAVPAIFLCALFFLTCVGAGISTAAGIGDYRGIHGKWTERDKKKTYGTQFIKTFNQFKIYISN